MIYSYPLNVSIAFMRRFVGSLLFDSSLIFLTHRLLNMYHKDLPADIPHKINTIIPKIMKSSVNNVSQKYFAMYRFSVKICFFLLIN